MIGLGDAKSKFKVYIANRPDYADLMHIDSVRPVTENEIYNIGQRCGNGWRKVFNVYAKLVFALKSDLHPGLTKYQRWQQWRDDCLLRENSNSALLFSRPAFVGKQIEQDTDSANLADRDAVHLIMGKGWAKECLPEHFISADSPNWLNQDFAVIASQNIIVCPYFDYRQLSDQKIIYLCDLIRTLLNQSQPNKTR